MSSPWIRRLPDPQFSSRCCRILDEPLLTACFPLHYRLELCGGTDVAFAPPADYARCVLLPHLNSLFGIDAQLEVRRRGFFPRGGGEIAVEVATRDKLRPFELVERGQVVRICGVAVAQGGGGGARGGAGRGRGGRRAGGRRGGVKGATGGRGGRVTSAAEEAGGASAAEEAGGASGADAASMAAGAREALRAAAQLAGVPTAIEVEEPPGGGCGEGGVLVLWAETSGGCRLGASALLGRGDSPGEVGRRAAADLAALLASGACVDEHMQDQLVLFMALADGAAPSRLRAGPLTLHTRTAIVRPRPERAQRPRRPREGARGAAAARHARLPDCGFPPPGCAQHFAEAMIGAKFTVTEEDGGGALIECEGAGYPGKTQ